MRSFKPWTLLEHGGRDYAFSGIVRPVARFIKTEQLSSIILLAATAAALIWVNSPFDHEYFEFWHTELGFDAGLFGIHLTLEEWVNDGLMAVFFFVIGLEIKREVVHGELREPRKAALPVMAAIGGMIVPALIFFAFNGTGEDGRGWGIPLATDIAFALGVLALLGRFLPAELRIFLLALAVVDDIGSILVIAVFYTDSVDVQALGWGVLLLGAMVAAYRVGGRSIGLYAILGFLFWAAIEESGIHATIAGVILGFLTPAHSRYSPAGFRPSMETLASRYEAAAEKHDEPVMSATLVEIDHLAEGSESMLERLERQVHPWSSYLILPLFALANAGIALSGGALSDAFSNSVTFGVIAGLVVGKTLGVTAFTYIAVKSGLAVLPRGVTWTHITGTAMLAGIGFTVSIFIAGLAYGDELASEAKIGVLIASLIAGVSGYLFLKTFGARAPARSDEQSPAA